jgi:endonuclease/exonuclease/phosphatase family metal-dependent hydrolase
MKLTLTTLNLQGFEQWDERKPRILEYLKRIDADVVVFQEAVFLPSISPHNQAQLLNQDLNYPYQVSTISRLQASEEYPVYREGLAIVSKYHIRSSDTLILKKAEGDEHNRILQLVDVWIDNTIIRIGHIHFSITDVIDYATPQLEETLSILKARNEKRILIGDFNLSHLEETSHLWEGDYIASTDVPYITYPNWHEGPKRTDYALIPKEYAFTSISVSEDGLSDHRALTVEIELE